MGNTTLLGISTLLSEVNFYTRLMKMRDPVTHQPIFTFLSVELACPACKADGKASQCVHMLHLVPRWQSADRHVKLKTIMQDRPDLIESELAGLAFDSLQQVFKREDLDVMFAQIAPSASTNDDIHLFIDPAAGGPYSDYAMLSVTRQKGMVTVRPLLRLAVPREPREHRLTAAPCARVIYNRPRLRRGSMAQLTRYVARLLSMKSARVTSSSLTQLGITSLCSCA